MRLIRPGARDAVLVAALIGAAVVEGVLRSEPVLLTVALLPLLLWRRYYPLTAVAIASAAAAVAVLVAHSEPRLQTAAALLLLPYSLVRWGSPRSVALGTPLVLGKIVLAAAAGLLSWTEMDEGFATMAALGAAAAALRYRARALDREREHIRLLERERLARDLNDTVAHHVSAIAVQAQAGRFTGPIETLRRIKAEGAQTLAEMRLLLRTLRPPKERLLSPTFGRDDSGLETDAPGLGGRDDRRHEGDSSGALRPAE
ncbi:histidine kinase [Dactylosporangium sp. NPDC051541]|uniref:histidine kinase n=1 Tax=Dactylosporangium sp. NPDC051541 TaxID=3363977 RepID=UPI0037BBF8BF